MYLTRRQLEMVDFIREFRDAHRISPTLDEIARHFGVSKITVFEHIEALKKKGVVQKVKNHARSIQLVADGGGGAKVNLAIEGSIPRSLDGAGADGVEGFSLSRLLSGGTSCFALRVEGDSLTNSRLEHGDVLVVERRQPHDGETTVVQLPNGDRVLSKTPKGAPPSTDGSSGKAEGVVIAVVRIW